MPESFDHIVVIDTGGTSARRILKKLRALGVASVLVSAARIEINENTKGAIIAGNGIVLKASQDAENEILMFPVPLLALGTNAEAVLRSVGGEIESVAFEKRAAHVDFYESTLFSGLTEGDRYFERLTNIRLPDGAVSIAGAEGYVSAYQFTNKPLYGAFFSVESNDPDGLKMLENFARIICKCEYVWNMESFLSRAVSKIEALFPSSYAAVACSGGLMSTVSFLIANRALGQRAECVIVDTGLLPKDETELAQKAIYEASKRSATILDAKEETFLKLKGVTNAREKRDIVYKIIHEKIKEHTDHSILAPFIGDYFPTSGLFRDEVRALGKLLGLSDTFLSRRPFPGAGLAVRISGEVTDEKAETLKNADHVFEHEIRLSGLDKKLWQYYASMITSDAGAFIILHALLNDDHAGGYAYRLPYDVIEKTVMRTMELCPDAEGILYDVSGRWAPLFSL